MSNDEQNSRPAVAYASADGLPPIKPWQERVTDSTPAHEYPDAMRAEIAELRAALSRQHKQEAEPQANYESMDHDRLSKLGDHARSNG